jgi:3-hydroxyisobutyrate dehydrogenase-like beta-hydroxyacid dehydrogenase
MLKAGAIVIDTSTVGYRETKEIAQQLATLGIAFFDVPVSGMEARVKDGTLTVMCGADPEVFLKIQPYLQTLGNTILRVGDVGAGQLMRLINQLLFDINAAALAEILPMAVKLGLDAAQVAEVVNTGTGRSYASEFFVPRIFKRHFSDGYPMKAAYKDLVSGADISAHIGIPMLVLSAATVTY